MKKFISSGTIIIGVYVISGLLFGGVTLGSHTTPMIIASNQNELVCFDKTTESYSIYNDQCVIPNDNQDSANFSNPDKNTTEAYSGVYITNTTLAKQTLNQITQLSYDYTGNTNPQPGSLSFNLPIDTDSNNETDTYLLIDISKCLGVNGQVNIIHDVQCQISVNNLKYSNWEELIRDNPTWRAVPDNAFPFISIEWSHIEPLAIWEISNIKLDKNNQ